MKILKWIIAFIAVICMASIADLLVNYLLANTTNWVLGEKRITTILVNLGRFSIGWFYLAPQIKVIYNKLGSDE